ncbi:phosphoglucosamine mutase [Blastopirellula retiformator]|uniref:Phosphoglucosamine mutase n=1 Tax=Blastopirellula retiformator TaxID=2527970 RepID=A0A5C5UWR8_9BACT|nr:phosphoglucosamine mutase [Blastopirellula retiformator]TWT30816.1 Phosphoglucosamine mutase [Blastopirellula retiformator]
MKDPIISVSGLRGVVGESLTPEIAVKYVAAFAQQAAPGPILIARDGRPSGKPLAELIAGTLNFCGRDVIQADIAATPTVGVLTRQYGCGGAVQISASHNPPQYNGIKLMGQDGRVIPANQGERVLEAYRSGAAAWAPHEKLGATSPCDDTLSAHLEKVLAIVDVDTIRKRNFRVLLDSNEGAGSLLGRKLLEALGCEFEILGDQASGNFLHTPEPTEANLQGVRAKVVESGADIGFCQDPDADRLAIIDSAGRYIGEEYTVALCLNHVLTSRPGPVVINCATSLMNEAIAKKHGAPIFRSAVGEANVTDMMIAQGAVFGGEGNGGPIDPRVGYIRDSFVGMALILDTMAATSKTVGTLTDSIPRFEILKTTMPLDREQLAGSLDKLVAHFSTVDASRLDGLRFAWEDAWLLIRGSNTEPIVRIIAESPNIDRTEELCQEAAKVMQGA